MNRSISVLSSQVQIQSQELEAHKSIHRSLKPLLKQKPFSLFTPSNCKENPCIALQAKLPLFQHPKFTPHSPFKSHGSFPSSPDHHLEFPSKHPPLSLHQMPLEEEKPKKLDHEVRDMVSAIMGRIPILHRPGSSQTSEEDDDRGVRIVTLAGSNIGATLKSEMDEKLSDPDEELDAMSTYVNSNFQAVNNSIMMGGSYTTNDPGVHLEVSDFVDHHGREHHKLGKKEKKKKKKKDQESEKSDQQTEHSE